MQPIGCCSRILKPAALPRVRDFRGISGRAFDGRGNYNIGVKEQIIFPEIEYDKVGSHEREAKPRSRNGPRIHTSERHAKSPCNR